MNVAYSQTNTLPPNGNVGIGTTSPTSTLQVNGTAQIDSALYVKDSVVINRSARVKDVLRVDKEVIVKGELRAKDDFRVTGTSRLKGDVILQEGDLKIKSLADSTQSGKRLLMVNSNGKVTKGEDLLHLVYNYSPLNNLCQDVYGGDPASFPGWQRDKYQIFLLNSLCVPDVKLGVGIKPVAKFHIVSNNNSTLPFLIEKNEILPSQGTKKLLQLDNDGTLKVRKVMVDNANWPDYVFDKKYKLRSIEEIKAFISENKHLPDMPNAKEVETQGLDLGEMVTILTKKIEELTLYLIQQQELIESLQEQFEKENP